MFDDDDDDDTFYPAGTEALTRRTPGDLLRGAGPLDRPAPGAQILGRLLSRTVDPEPRPFGWLLPRSTKRLVEEAHANEEVFNIATRMIHGALALKDAYQDSVVRQAERETALARAAHARYELQQQRELLDYLAPDRRALERERLLLEKTKLLNQRHKLNTEMAERNVVQGRREEGRPTVTAVATRDLSTLARRIVDDAVTGSAAPDHPDRYFHPLAAASYVAKITTGASEQTAEAAAYEAVHRALQLDASGRQPMTRDRARADYAAYQRASEKYERNQNLDDLGDILKSVTGGGAAGKDIFE